MGTHEHKKEAPETVNIGIISISTTRSLAEDKSGHWIRKRAGKEGHSVVFHNVVDDDKQLIAQMLLGVIQEKKPHIMLLTGGTGIAPRDVTIEAVTPLFTKELTAFGSIFAQLSHEEIDSAAIMSRATAGLIDKTIVFCIPGSLKACKLACKALIFPEAGHLVKHVYTG